MALLVGKPELFGVSDEQIREFYKASWGRPTILAEAQFYSWQFLEPPTAQGRSDDLLVAFDDNAGVIAGVTGVVPRPFNLAGKASQGAELTTWVVADDYRSTGVGALMMNELTKKYDALVAMGVTKFSLPVFLRSGFRIQRAIPRYLRPYNLQAVSEIGAVDPLARKLQQKWTPTAGRANYQVDEDVAAADQIWNRFSQTHHGFARDAEHLAWRYLNHPVFTYRVFTITTGEAQAVVALRIEDAVPGIRILHVVDLFGDDDAIAAAFDFVDDFSVGNDIDIADFFCSSTKVGKHPLAKGWFSALDDQSLRFPHLFHPVTMRDPPTTTLVYWSKENFAEMCDFSGFYVTKSDADFDRPVAKPKDAISA
ncbi:GNAT family N-acetyltransferase [Labrys portucalensis]|uniref:GNAT family N-acetyltransferase n=1 Tax=Labrys neptuniae TaxID=376174 RepID=A0ABV6Z953_9HYPH